MIEKQPGTDWRDLQRRVAAILEECGIEAEIGKTLSLARGKAEIDVYAKDQASTPPGVYLCECKRWASAVPQAAVQAFRTIVSDAGAHHGLFISANGFQAGCYEVATNTNIHLFDWVQFQEMFLERWCKTYWVPVFRRGADRLAGSVEPLVSDASTRAYNGEPLEPEEAAGLIALEMWGHPFNPMPIPRTDRLAPAIWQLRDKYRAYLPSPANETAYLRELLDSLLEVAAEWIAKRETESQ